MGALERKLGNLFHIQVSAFMHDGLGEIKKVANLRIQYAWGAIVLSASISVGLAGAHLTGLARADAANLLEIAESANKDKSKENEKSTGSDKDKSTAEKAGEKKNGEKAAIKSAPEPPIPDVVNVTTDQLTEHPADYLNKNVKFSANFFAFCSLALDYPSSKPMRSSKNNLSFLVLRPASHVPYSEIKIAMAMPKEKDPQNLMLTQLKDGDQLEITGKVFSTALDEPWLDVLRLKKTGSAPEDKKTAEEKDKDEAETQAPPPNNGSKTETKTKPESPTKPDNSEKK